MGLYCGIDLHSNNHMLTVIDEADRRVYERRLPNDLAITKAALEPYRAELVAVAVESTFYWYWLVDGLMEAGYAVRLVNTAAVRQYEGLKHTDDEHDAFGLAHLMRLAGHSAHGVHLPQERARTAGPGPTTDAFGAAS
jgi:transposase